ncbi:MAG: hypothetical protein KDH09_12455 [Chrysiogenetes bacterium]|nr:hypothetical protein [Chrysiogenetes bacterium]
MVGLPGLVVLFRSLITARPTPRRTVLKIIAFSIFVHAPAMTPLGIRSMERVNGAPIWHYGPWEAVVWIAWLIGLPLFVRWVWRNRGKMPWDECNRILWVSVILLSCLSLETIAMGILGYVLQMHRVMMIVPALSVIPFLVVVVVFRAKSLPDLWGWIGRVLPNERSRFVSEFRQLEAGISGYHSSAELTRDLSKLLRAPVRFVRAPDTGHRDEARLWVAPAGLHRIYSPDDQRRLERIEAHARGLHADELIHSSLRQASSDQIGACWPAASQAAAAERELFEVALTDKKLIVASLPPGMWGEGCITCSTALRGSKVLEITCESDEAPPREQWRPHLARAVDRDVVVVSVRHLTVIPEPAVVELAALIAGGKKVVILAYESQKPGGALLELCRELGQGARMLRLSEQLDREEDIRAWLERLLRNKNIERNLDATLAPEVLQSLLEMDWAQDGVVLTQLLECSLSENT